METTSATTTITSKESVVTGVSRSGRVRKKSSKLLDFQSDEVESRKPKRTPTKQTRPHGPGTGGGQRGRPPKHRNRDDSRSTVPQPAAKTPSYLHADGQDGEDVDEEDDNDDDDEEEDEDDEEELQRHLNDIRNSDSPLIGGSLLMGSFVGGAGGDGVGGGGVQTDSDYELDELVADIVGGVEAESLQQDGFGSPVRQSLYMTEKANKRKILQDGRVITKRLERKDKGKARLTAYSLWASEFRKTKTNKSATGGAKDTDFANTSRRLAEIWSNVSNKEKSAWRRKAKMQAARAKNRDAHDEPEPPAPAAPYVRRHASVGRPRKHPLPVLVPPPDSPQPSPASTRTSHGATAGSAAPARTIPQTPATPTTPAVRANGLLATPPSNVSPKRRRTTPLKANPNTSATSQQQHPTNNNNKSPSKQCHTSPPSTSTRRSATVHTMRPQTTPQATPAPRQTKAQSCPQKDTAHTATVVAYVDEDDEPLPPPPPDTQAIDAAAHLKLLGESLTVIGERLIVHEGPVALSGSLSVLLDSLLCSIGPLLCLTKYLPGLDNNPQLDESLSRTLDNIAYVMPGV